MRILNRPMFRYGGPINEGLMHGMRNNYRSGQLVRPGPGRPGYQGPPKTKLGMAGWLATKLPWWSKIKTGTKDIIPKTIKKIKGSQPFENMQGIFTQTGKGSGITSSPAATTFMQNLRSFPGASKIPGWATKAKDIAFKYPKSTAAGVLYGGPTVIGAAKQIPWSKIGQGLDPRPGWRKVFGIEEEIDEKDGTDTITEKIAPIGPGAQFLEDTAPLPDPDAAKKLAQQKQNERLKSYLDMMGYDSAKKGALSDALIDASALVQDATTEAGSIKKADWGNLINKMIQTTSKRLDKPEQIREAVGLMMTKGEIEKDIAKGKENALDQQVSTLMNNLGYDRATATRVAKGLPKDLREQVIIDMGTSKQNLTHSSLTSSVKKWYPEAIALLDTTEVKKQLGNQSAEEFITEKIKDNPTTNKIYIVGKEVVKVDGEGRASTIFP